MERKPYVQAAGEYYYKQRMRCFVRDDITCQCEALDLPEIKGLDGHCTFDKPQTRLSELECHHKKFRIQGGDHDLDNLVTVCKLHHDMYHPHRQREIGEWDKPLGDYPLKELG